MKKITIAVLALAVAFICMFALISCNEDKNNETVTTAQEIQTTVAEEGATTMQEDNVTTVAEEPTTVAEVVTTVVEEVTTIAENTSDTESGGEEATDTGTIDFPVGEGDIVIAGADDFINFNKTVLTMMSDASDKCLEGITVHFAADIDMSGYNWTPIDGYYLDDVTFDGRGHKITNLSIVDPEADAIGNINGEMFGFGLIQSATYDLTFKNLTFEDASVTAYNKHVGLLVGTVYEGATISCTNVNMYDVKINGALADDKDNNRVFSIRCSCYVGAIMGVGYVDFTNCTVNGAYISGYHNLAVFLGYDGGATIDGSFFENCNVSNIEMEFSYCQSASYTNKKPYAFVSVFFNATQWIDTVDMCTDNGNFYSNVTYKDWTTDEVFNAETYRSWTEDSEYFQMYLNKEITLGSAPEVR